MQFRGLARRITDPGLNKARGGGGCERKNADNGIFNNSAAPFAGRQCVSKRSETKKSSESVKLTPTRSVGDGRRV